MPQRKSIGDMRWSDWGNSWSSPSRGTLSNRRKTDLGCTEHSASRLPPSRRDGLPRRDQTTRPRGEGHGSIGEATDLEHDDVHRLAEHV
eukprot:6712876-Pyramimonas_sp.AAC.1